MTFSTGQWRSLSSMRLLLAPLAATDGGEGRRHTTLHPGPALQDRTRLRPRRWRASTAQALEESATGCSLGGPKSCAAEPGEAAARETAEESHSAALNLQMASQMPGSRNSGSESCASALSPVRHAAAQAIDRTNSDHLWSRSWPARVLSSCSISRLATAPNGPSGGSSLGNDPVRFGAWCEASPACDRGCGDASASTQRGCTTLTHYRAQELSST